MSMKRKWIAMEEIRQSACEHCGQLTHVRSCIAEMKRKDAERDREMAALRQTWEEELATTEDRANKAETGLAAVEATVEKLTRMSQERQAELEENRAKVAELVRQSQERQAEFEAIKASIVKADDALIRAFTEEVAKIREEDEEKIQ